MLKIGLTGGIGSGKTTIAKIFETLAIPVFNADNCAKALLLNTDIKKQLFNWFGNDIISNNEVDRKKMANIIFNNSDALLKVNNLIHPRVAEEFNKWVMLNKHKPFVIKEAAIIFENKINNNLDATILVTAPLEDRIKRVQLRDNIDSELVKQRINNQLPDSEKRKLATYEIVNDNKHMLIPRVLEIYKKII